MKKQQNNSLQRRQHSIYLALAIVFIVLFLPIISALEFDNIKSYDALKKEITITNAFGLGGKLADIKLDRNTDYCLINCFAEGTTTLYSDGSLFSDFNFKNTKGINVNVKTSKIYIQKSYSYNEDVTENVCGEIRIVANGTEQDCETKKIGTKIVIKDYLEEYKYESLKAGTYVWKIETNKNLNERVDWVATSLGKDLTEWAWWNGGWTAKKQLNITGGTSDLTDFVAYVQVDKQASMNTDYSDLRFINGTEDTELSYEIDWKNTSGVGVWVKIPTLKVGVNTIYMYYGNVGATTTSDGATTFGNNANAVYHFQNNSINAFDSSVSKNNGTIIYQSGSNITLNSSGVFGNQYYISPTAYVQSINNIGISGNRQHTVVGYFKETITGQDGTNWQMGNNNINGEYAGMGTSTGSQWKSIYHPDQNYNSINTNQHFIASVFDGTNIFNYMDGILLNSYLTTSLALPNASLFVGVTTTGSSISDALFDEFRVYNTTFTSEWINRTMRSNDTSLYLFGDEVSTIMSISTTLISPANAIDIGSNSSFYFSSSQVSLNNNLTNATLYIWKPDTTLFGTNYTILSGTSNTTNLSISGLIEGNNYTWNYESCGTNGTATLCSFGISNRTFNVSFYNLNSVLYNSTSFETSPETFELNLSAGGIETITATFTYDGTVYSSTKIGDNSEMRFTSTAYVPSITSPINKTFWWNITYGSTVTGTNIYNQSIERLLWDVCNASVTNKFLNFTFKDETNSSVIDASVPASTFIYTLGDGRANKTKSYSNTPVNVSYGFCSNQNMSKPMNVDTSFSYTAPGYIQRTYETEILAYTFNLNKTLYLLSSVDGIYVTFQVVNTADQVLSGVSVNATRDIGGTETIVASGITDAAGSVTFWLNPNYAHTFSFLKSGYTQFITSITPTQTSYTVTLSSTSTTSTNDYTRGISYSIGPPQGEYLINSTVYSFNYTLTSSYWNVNSFGFVLMNLSGTNLGSASAATNGGIVNTNVNTWNQTRILMNYYYVIDGNYTNGTASWIVITDEGSGYSIKNFKDRLITYLGTGLFGLNKGFSLNLIIYFVIFIFVGVMSYKFGISNLSAISLMLLGLIALFDMGLGLISLDSQLAAIEHFPTIFISTLFIGLLIWEAYK